MNKVLDRSAVATAAGALALLAAGIGIASGTVGALIILLIGYYSIFLWARGAKESLQPAVQFAALYGLVLLACGIAIWKYSPPIAALAYVSSADRIAASGLSSTDYASPAVMVDGKSGYVLFLATVTFLLGGGPYVAIAMNAVAIMWLLIICARTADSLGSCHPHRASFAVALFPGLLLWGSPPLREAAVVLCIGIIVDASVQLSARARLGGAWMRLVGASLALLVLRGSLGVVVPVAALLSIFIAEKEKSRVAVVPLGLTAIAAVWAIAPSIVSSTLSRTDPTIVAVSLEELSRSSSGFTQSSGPIGRIAAVARVLLGPFPWELGSAGISSLEAPVWIAATILAISRVRSHGRQVAVPALIGLSIALAIAISVGNYGTLLRMRLMIIPCLAVLLSLGSRTKSPKLLPDEMTP